jgi:hypothetical protein
LTRAIGAIPLSRGARIGENEGPTSGTHRQRLTEGGTLWTAGAGGGDVGCLTDGAIHPGAQLTRARFSRSVTEEKKLLTVRPRDSATPGARYRLASGA